MKKTFFLPFLACLCACHSSLTENESDAPAVSQTLGTPAVLASNQSLVPELQPLAAQTFVVPAGNRQWVQAQKGLKVFVDAAKLETLDGKPVAGSVSVQIKEMQTPEDMIREHCATVSNGRLLSSGGSYFVAMEANGEALRIRSGQSLPMTFPKIKDGKMDLFYGEKQTNGEVNWIPAQQSLQSVPVAAARKTWVKIKRKVNFANNNINVNATAGFLASMAWLKAFEDSTFKARRAWLARYHDSLPPKYISAYLQWPLKISGSEKARLRIPLSNNLYKKNTESFTMVNTDGSQEVSHHFEKFFYNDSFVYYRDTLFHDLNTDKNWMVKEDKNSSNVSNSVPFDYTTYNSFGDDAFQQVSGNSGEDLSEKVWEETTEEKAKVTVQYYEPAEIQQLGYINCDRFYEYKEGFTPVYTLQPSGEMPAVVGVYTIFRDINGMMQHQVATKGSDRISISDRFPLNAKVELIIYGRNGGTFVQCKRKVTITPNLNVPIAFEPVPKEDLKKVFLN